MNVTQINDFLKKVAFIAENSTCGYKVGCVGVIKDEGQKISPEAARKTQIRSK